MATEDETVTLFDESHVADMKKLAQELNDAIKARKDAIDSYNTRIVIYRRLNELDEQEGKPPRYQKELDEALKVLNLLERIEDDIKRVEPLMNQVPGSSSRTRTVGNHAYYIQTTPNSETPVWTMVRKRIVAEGDDTDLDYQNTPARQPEPEVD